MRGPTIRDVARHAGVSAATVSRVLNDSPLVLEPTRERVQAAVDELGYRLNATARNLSIGRAMAIGVVVPFFTAPSVIERLRGVVERLGRGERREYDLMLFDVEAPEQRAGALRDLARRDRVAGLLIISLPVSRRRGRRARARRAARRAGRRRPPAAPARRDRQRPRRRARRRAPARAGPSPDRVRRRPSHQPVRLHVQRGSPARFPRRAGARRGRADPALERFGPHGRDEAGELAEALLTLPDPPSAIFAASDLQAIGVLKAAERLGVRVPEDLAVIGFDDVDLAEIVGLTTIRQPLREGGALAADLLLAAIEHGVDEPGRGAAGADRRRAAHDVIEAVLSDGGLAVRVGAAGRAGRPRAASTRCSGATR